MDPDVKNVLNVISKLKTKFKEDTLQITCGYEAGCLGYTLHHELKEAGINCVILAPSTMEVPGGKRIKTDKRDAHLIAKCLANGGYSEVHIPTQLDEDVRDYIRMRDDHKDAQRVVKQQINSFCLRHGHKYEKARWTAPHLKWLKELKLTDFQKEILDEYILTYTQLEEKIKRLDARIEDLSQKDDYKENVSKLKCFLGVRTQGALSLIVETGDFARFKNGAVYSAYLGLTPGEASSSDSINRLSITKAGNIHARTVLVEAAQGICKGRIGMKSKELKSRQKGNSPSVIAYADKANERLRRKYYRMMYNGKQRNVAVTAVARELGCFVWGMMTGNIS